MATVHGGAASAGVADVAALEAAIAAFVGRLGHIARVYPIVFRPPAGREVVPALTMLDTANLRGYFERAVLDWSADPTVEDIRAAASRFMRRYAGTIAHAALVPLLNGVAFDVAIGRVRFIISASRGESNMPGGVVLDLPGEIVGTAERRTTWPVSVARQVTLEQLRARAVGNLIVDHLRVAIDRVVSAVQLSPTVLWTTVAEQVASLYDGLYERPDPATTPEEYARADADKEVLLNAAQLPGVAGRNPLLDLLYWEQVDDPLVPRPVHVRRMCCVNFVVPGRPQPYCRNCALISYEERSALRLSFRQKLAQRP